jgi:hypothetical protein
MCEWVRCSHVRTPQGKSWCSCTGRGLACAAWCQCSGAHCSSSRPEARPPARPQSQGVPPSSQVARTMTDDAFRCAQFKGELVCLAMPIHGACCVAGILGRARRLVGWGDHRLQRAHWPALVRGSLLTTPLGPVLLLGPRHCCGADWDFTIVSMLLRSSSTCTCLDGAAWVAAVTLTHLRMSPLCTLQRGVRVRHAGRVVRVDADPGGDGRRGAGPGGHRRPDAGAARVFRVLSYVSSREWRTF